MARAKQQLEAIVTPEKYPAGVPEKIGDDLYVLQKNGDEIFRGTKKEVDELVEQFKKMPEAEAKKFLDEIVIRVSRNQNIQNNYLRKYVGKELQPLVDPSTAFRIHGKSGGDLVKAVNIEVEKLLNNFNRTQLNKHVMVSGMIYRQNSKISNVYIKSNFLSSEIGEFNEIAGKFFDKKGKESVYQHFLDNIHPTLEKRYKIHLQERTKGLNAASLNDVDRAGQIASHGEIRALDDLLKEIDPKGTLGDVVFKDILGYNRFLAREGIQPPCVHCFYLTNFVTYIGL